MQFQREEKAIEVLAGILRQVQTGEAKFFILADEFIAL